MKKKKELRKKKVPQSTESENDKRSNFKETQNRGNPKTGRKRCSLEEEKKKSLQKLQGNRI